MFDEQIISLQSKQQQLQKICDRLEFYQEIKSNRSYSLKLIAQTIASLSTEDYRPYLIQYKKDVLALFGEDTPKPNEKIKTQTSSKPNTKTNPKLKETVPTDIPNNVWTGLTFTSNAEKPFARAMMLHTHSLKLDGKLQKDCPISFRDNPFRLASSNSLETYLEDKPAGEPYLSAADAFYHFSQNLEEAEQLELMIEVAVAKFNQYPKLVDQINRAGGAAWLCQCSYFLHNDDMTKNEDSYWEGEGLNSAYILALVEAYKQLQFSNSSNLQSNVAKLSSLKEQTYSCISYKSDLNQLEICFNNLQRARSWGKYLHQELEVGSSFTVERYTENKLLCSSTKKPWKHKLTIENVSSDDAEELIDVDILDLPERQAIP